MAVREGFQQLVDEVSLDTLREMYTIETDLIDLISKQLTDAKLRRQSIIIQIDKRDREAKAISCRVAEGEGEVGYEGER